MSIELKVPSMGESVVEIELGEWLKKEGETVARDEAVVVLESDKVTLELPAPTSGTVTKILKQEGDTAEVGEVIGHMEEGDVVPASAGVSAAAESSAPAPPEPAKAAPAPLPADGGEARVMPAAQRVMAEKGLGPADVVATGPGGRILKEDAQRAAASAAPAAPAPPAPAPIPAAVPSGARQEDVVPMSRLRRRIAERLVESQQTAALLTTFNEIDMTAVKELRARYKDDFASKYGSKLGFMSFFVKAAIDALKLVPTVNAEIRDNEIAYKNYYDIGIAVGGGRGLVVPVLRDADRMSFAQVELKISDFAVRARDNALTLDELQGGTFTISNGGVYGSMMSTPIVNPPQTGILGLHAIKDRPVAIDGEVAVRPMMYVALTYDHRLIDGRESVTFLKRIKEVIEEPSRILLEI